MLLRSPLGGSDLDLSPQCYIISQSAIDTFGDLLEWLLPTDFEVVAKTIDSRSLLSITFDLVFESGNITDPHVKSNILRPPIVVT